MIENFLAICRAFENPSEVLPAQFPVGFSARSISKISTGPF